MKTNSKKPSRSTSADKERNKETTTSQMEAGSDPSSEMDDQELAAFNAIMSEIGGQAETTARMVDGDTSSDLDAEPAVQNDETSRNALSDSTQDPSSSEESEDLDAEQQKAFESIMAQIESGNSQDAGDDTDDFAAELEKVAQQAESQDANGIESKSSSEDLDAEQQKAFESIMAQIESGNSQDAGDDTPSLTDEGDATDDTDDFAAELEKVAQQSETQATDSAKRESSDDLQDADARKAFESVTAPIANGNSQATADDADAIAPKNDVSSADDDSSGELEKVVKTADPGGDVESKRDASDDELDEDQRKAFESILAQIESGGKGQANRESDADQPLQPSEAEQDTTPDTPPSISVEGGDENASQEVTDDIEKILQEIALDDQDPPQNDSTSKQTMAESTVAVSPEAQTAVDTLTVKEKESRSGNRSAAPPDRTSENIDDTFSDPLNDDNEDHHSPATEKVDSENAPKTMKTRALREAGRSVEKKRSRTLIATVVFGILLALAATVYWQRREADRSTPLLTSTSEGSQYGTVDAQPASPIQPNQTLLPVQAPSDQSRLSALIERLNQLRNQLDDKRTEIDDLRNYYQAGIDAEIEGIAQAVARSGRTDLSFKRAMADTRISLGLSAIQRRDIYMRKLLSPMDTLQHGSEELLYLSKKAELLSMMVQKTSDIDVDGYMAHAADIMDRHANTLKELDIEGVPATPITFESLWQGIVKHVSDQSTRKENDSGNTGSDITNLSRQICGGDFTDKHRLTALSPEVARCLARWKGKDLFLNALTELSPEAARYLADWEGDWLGLNGLKELSPETAAHLARWKGKGLSLNGLQRLSPRVVAILSEWQGDQIELVNVKHMAHWENTRTTLFLSEALRRKINTARK